jgi:hypothetical protein
MYYSYNFNPFIKLNNKIAEIRSMFIACRCKSKTKLLIQGIHVIIEYNIGRFSADRCNYVAISEANNPSNGGNFCYPW